MNNIQSLQFIYPEMGLAGFALLTLILSVFTRQKSFIGVFSLLGVVISLKLLPLSFTTGPLLFFGLLINDAFSIFFREIILLIAGLIILISVGYKEWDSEDIGEYYFFLLVLTASMMLAVASNNLLMIYIAIESISVVSYILVGYLKRDILSSEAGIKYFLFGALSTGVMLYGISLIYGLFGTLDLNLIFEFLKTGGVNQPALFLALCLMLAGLGFKSSLVPFHMWTPDVYQGAPTPVTALLSVGPKAVGFALMLRVFLQNFEPISLYWVSVASAMAILTMTVGNITAIGQSNIKRLLAYSTIAQAGYIFIGLAVATTAGVKATLFYIFVYTLMNIGAFAAVIMVANSVKSEAIEDYAGLYKTDPLTAVILAILLLSLAGIPPLAGFWAKFFVLAAAVEAKLVTLAVVAVINSVIAFYYYVRVIKFMFLQEPSREIQIFPQSALHLVLIITALANVIIGIWPSPLLNWLTSLTHL